MTCYLTPQGNSDLLARRSQAQGRLKELIRERGKRRSTVNVAHDGSGVCNEHLDSDREEQVLEQSIAKMTTVLQNAIVTERPKDADRLHVGHVATIQRCKVDGTRIGRPERYYVGGYEETDTSTVPPTLSYNAPILANLLGRRVDPNRDPARVILSGGVVYVELKKIEIAPKAGVTRPAPLKVVG